MKGFVLVEPIWEQNRPVLCLSIIGRNLGIMDEENSEKMMKKNQQGTDDFGWRFHLGPLAISAVITLLFYIFVLIFFK